MVCNKISHITDNKKNVAMMGNLVISAPVKQHTMPSTVILNAAEKRQRIQL